MKFDFRTGADSQAKSKLKIEVLASDSDGYKTQDGTYYVYMYAKRDTTVTVTIDQVDTGSKCKNSKANERAARSSAQKVTALRPTRDSLTDH